MVGRFTVIEVLGPVEKKEFLEFPVRLYKNEPNWIRPLNDDIEKVFDPRQNKLFRKGEAVRWLFQEEGQTIGRVAAFWDPATSKTNSQPTGGIGFFECINEKEAAHFIFDTAREWLTARGLEAMDGPVNFGERDNFWGCLVDGFYEPNFNMPFNFPYYQQLFESYGFKDYFQQYTYHMNIDTGNLNPIIREKAIRVFNNPDYRFDMISWKNINKFAEDFTTIFNAAWGRFAGVKKVTKHHSLALLNQMKPILDTRLVYFAYYKNEPIAFFIMMPDLNQITKYLNGKMNTINKLRFMYLLRIRKKAHRIIGRIFGTIPEHQGKGVEAGLIMAFEKEVYKPGFPYTDLEMNWIGDFNPTMMKLCEQIGAKIRKTHITYRYLFDQSKPFERAKKVS